MKDKIVTIATHTYSRAQLIKGHLEAKGIDCLLSNVNLIQSDISAGVKINVREKDIKKALEIINSVQYDYGEKKKIIIEKLKEVRKILVPIDFSPYAEKAIEYALEMAKTLKAEIMLLHVFYNPAIVSEPFGSNFAYMLKMDEYTKEIESNAKNQMEEFTKKLKQKLYKENIYNFRIRKTVIGGGVIDDSIIKFAETYKPGVIIMGTKGKGEKAYDIIGSVASEVIEKVEVPVLAVPCDSSCKSLSDIKSILYATDFIESDFDAIRKLMSLIRPFNLMIHCIHIDSDLDDTLDKIKMDRIKQYFQKEYSEYNIKYEIINSDNVLKGIQKYVEDHKIGIISLTTKKRNLFQKLFNPSMARKMLFHTNTPLLVFQS